MQKRYFIYVFGNNDGYLADGYCTPIKTSTYKDDRLEYETEYWANVVANNLRNRGYAVEVRMA